MISLADARRLVECLEQGDNQSANQIFVQASQSANADLIDEVGKLTRQLHDAMGDFQIDERLIDLAKAEIPDARSRLEYVIKTTEAAANKTMDAVEESLPIAQQLNKNIKDLIPTWDKLMTRQIELSEFKVLCHSLNHLLYESEAGSKNLQNRLNDVLMAQDFQDLTGQVLTKVISLVKEVEDNLVALLKAYAADDDARPVSQKSQTGPQGPVIDHTKTLDAVSNQDEVDDLLSSLGF
ncbi:protein phosphatase CheZ [Gayadomonas joobiniege]|uniref:protein phosphatase CheZ n=1 Tax=Gayadomonas joobiniege TaxID=1234606 RepID=UPI00035DE6C8|nr:protein phosphatase CheZ [Gayadomonas joobiniege]